MPAEGKFPNLTRSQIEAEAKRVLQQHGLTSIPVDPVTLANLEGIKVHNAKFSSPNISGMIARRGSAKSVLVENDEPPYRKRFTIAHELGHYFLHLKEEPGEFVDTAVDLHRNNAADEGAGRKRVEVEANQFAAALLMPEEQVRQLYAAINDVEKLAELFRVSKDAMAIRLATLGLA